MEDLLGRMRGDSIVEEEMILITVGRGCTEQVLDLSMQDDRDEGRVQVRKDRLKSGGGGLTSSLRGLDVVFFAADKVEGETLEGVEEEKLARLERLSQHAELLLETELVEFVLEAKVALGLAINDNALSKVFFSPTTHRDLDLLILEDLVNGERDIIETRRRVGAREGTVKDSDLLDRL